MSSYSCPPDKHILVQSTSETPWNGCSNARFDPSECKCIDEIAGQARWRCEQCNLDYCGPCYDARFIFLEMKWACSLCLSEQNTLEEDCIVCKVNSQTFRQVQRNEGCIKEFIRLCSKGFDLNLGVSSLIDSRKYEDLEEELLVRENLLLEVKEFLIACMRFEESGFLIQQHFP